MATVATIAIKAEIGAKAAICNVTIFKEDETDVYTEFRISDAAELQDAKIFSLLKAAGYSSTVAKKRGQQIKAILNCLLSGVEPHGSIASLDVSLCDEENAIYYSIPFIDYTDAIDGTTVDYMNGIRKILMQCGYMDANMIDEFSIKFNKLQRLIF